MAHSSLFKLPPEIFLEISRKLSLNSVNALAQCCKPTYERINPILYRLDAKSPLRWALYWSCIVGNVSTAAISIASGSPIDQYCDAQLARPWEPTWRDGYSWESSPLDVALRRRHREVVNLLRRNGAKVTNWFTLEDLVVDIQPEDFVGIISQLRSQSYLNGLENLSLYRTVIEQNRVDLLPLCWDTLTRGASLERKEECFRDGLMAAIRIGSLAFVQAVIEIASEASSNHFNRSLQQVWLWSASISTGDGEAVFQYLDETYPFLAQTSNNGLQAWTFCAACRAGNITVANRLLQLGPLTLVSYDSWPLGAAIHAKRLEMVKFLLTRGSPRIRPDFEEQYEAEYEAVRLGSIEILEYLLSQTGDLSTINEDDEAIHAAVEARQTTMLEYMLSKGLRIPESGFKSLFSMESRLPPIEMVNLLLENGADPNLEPAPLAGIIKLVALEDARWANLDHEAALKMMKLLVSYGARFEHAVSDCHAVARSLCSVNESVKQYLFQQQPVLDAVDAELTLILCYSCSKQDAKVVQLVLDRGADATPPNPIHFYGTPLDSVFSSPFRGEDSIDVVKRLVAHGDMSRFTTTCAVFQLCADSTRAPEVQSLRLLLNNDPSSAALGTYHGRTALHAASRAGNALCVKTLLEAGADVEAIETWEGLLPIDEAFQLGGHRMRFSSKQATVIRLLLEYGSPIGRTELRAEHFAAIPELRKYIKR